MPKYTLSIEFDTEEEVRAYMGGETRAAVTAPAPEAEPAPAPEPEVEVTDATDADGLPYDAEIHATPRSFTANGLWRAKRGKGPEAEAARAEFKAAGGDVKAPEMPTMPGMPTAPTVEDDTPAPVSYQSLFDKTMGMIERGKIDNDGIQGLYKKIGLADAAALQTNESMRAALYSEMCQIEPELS